MCNEHIRYMDAFALPNLLKFLDAKNHSIRNLTSMSSFSTGNRHIFPATFSESRSETTIFRRKKHYATWNDCSIALYTGTTWVAFPLANRTWAQSTLAVAVQLVAFSWARQNFLGIENWENMWHVMFAPKHMQFALLNTTVLVSQCGCSLELWHPPHKK